MVLQNQANNITTMGPLATVFEMMANFGRPLGICDDDRNDDKKRIRWR